MLRFLVCLVMSQGNENGPAVKFQVYKVSEEVTYDNVTYPQKTISFFFCHSDSLESLYKNLIIFAPTSDHGILEANVDDISTIYTIGKKMTVDGMDWIYNPHCNSYYPFQDNLTIVEP